MIYIIGFWLLMGLVVLVAVVLGVNYFKRNYIVKKISMGGSGSDSQSNEMRREIVAEAADGEQEKDGVETSDNVGRQSTGDADTGMNGNADRIDESADTSIEEMEEHNRQLFFTCLRTLGCQPEPNDRGGVYFRHQGETYSAGIHKALIRIWDLPFDEVSKHDPSIPVILEAMNETNMGVVGPTVILAEANDEGMRSFISRMDLLDFRSVDDPVRYLDAVLDMFTDLRHRLRRELDKRLSSSGDPLRDNPIDPSMN